MIGLIKGRGTYIRLLLSKRKVALMASPGAVISLLGSYDALVSQLAGDPTKWPRIHDFLPEWSWQSWCLIALIPALGILAESAYRLHAVAQNDMGKLAGDDVSNAIARLSEHSFSLGDGTTAFRAFLALSEELTTGIEHIWILETLKEKLGDNFDWNSVSLNSVLSPLILAGVVTSHHKEGARPNESGVYRLGSVMPADVYTLTDLGIRVVNRARDDVFG